MNFSDSHDSKVCSANSYNHEPRSNSRTSTALPGGNEVHVKVVTDAGKMILLALGSAHQALTGPAVFL
jgi:hypothetical protein